MAQSGRSLLTTDENVARAYRFAIKAGIGSKRRTAGAVDRPPVRTVGGVSLTVGRAQPVTPDFAGLIGRRGLPLLFGNDCQPIEVARGHFWPFFQMPDQMAHHALPFCGRPTPRVEAAQVLVPIAIMMTLRSTGCEWSTR